MTDNISLVLPESPPTDAHPESTTMTLSTSRARSAPHRRPTQKNLVDLLEPRIYHSGSATVAADCGCEWLNSAKSHGLSCGCSGCAATRDLVRQGTNINCGYAILIRNLRDQRDQADGGGAFNLSDRWSSTATNGPTGRRGTGITLTYSFVPDGTPLPTNIAGESSDPSNLFARFNLVYGSPSVWQPIVRNAVELWGANSGLSLVYEPGTNGTFDDGAPHPNSPGLLGVRGDIRIGGHFINGNGGVLAYNYFPDLGDMVIDTFDNVVTNPAAANIRLRNIITHEIGHGLGFEHSCPGNNTKLMEPQLNTNFEGLAFDELLGVNYTYGDRLEKGAGNNTPTTATPLGTLTGTGSASRNTLSIVNSDPARGENAFADNDFFSFTLSARTRLTFNLAPLGTTYLAGTQNANGSCSPGTSFNALAQLNLRMEIRAANGTTVLGSANAAGTGQTESFTITLDPGNYFLRAFGDSVSGSKNTQMYDLTYDWQPVSVLPVSGGFDAVVPTQRTEGLSSHVVRFNQAVNPSTFTNADLLLTRDGVTESLAGTSISTSNNIDFTISGLSSLTTRLGTYTLQILADGVANDDGQSNASPISVSWTMTGLSGTGTTGTSANDTFTLRRLDASRFEVSVNGSTPYVVNNTIPAINVDASVGNDTLRVEGNLGIGAPVLTLAASSDNNDLIQLVGSPTQTNAWDLFSGRVVGPTSINSPGLARIEFTGSSAQDTVNFFSSNLPALRFNLADGNDQFNFSGQSSVYRLTQAVLGNTVLPRFLVQNFATLDLNSRFTLDQLVVGEGSTLNIQNTANRLITKALTVAGRLNVGLNELIVDYAPNTPSPAAAIRDALFLGYNAGLWNGSEVGSSGFRRGIVSSALSTGQTLAWAEAFNLVPPAGGIFNGQPIDNSAILVGPRLGGDANMDGTVNFSDLVLLARNFNQTSRTFYTGDFNYSANGLVDFSDLVILARNFNQSFVPPTPPLALLKGQSNLNGSATRTLRDGGQNDPASRTPRSSVLA